jgi:hypothetical protein
MCGVVQQMYWRLAKADGNRSNQCMEYEVKGS